MGQKLWHLLADSGLPCHYIIWQILNFGFVPKDIKVHVTFPSGRKVIENRGVPRPTVSSLMHPAEYGIEGHADKRVSLLPVCIVVGLFRGLEDSLPIWFTCRAIK